MDNEWLVKQKSGLSQTQHSSDLFDEFQVYYQRLSFDLSWEWSFEVSNKRKW